MNWVLLIAGFITLLFCGEFLVRGGISIALHFRISKLVIGMTLVSLGTSAPELVVSLQSVLSGHADVSTGTVIGSNLSNIGFILGLTILILPLRVHSDTVRFGWPVMMLATLMLWLVIQDGRISRWEGWIFVILLVSYVVFSIVRSRKAHHEPNHTADQFEKPKYSVLVSLLIIVVSITGLRFGASWLVKGATGIARDSGISEYVISLSLVAIGTSLPELATSLMAAIKKEADISIGNIIGSNLFNIWGILGITGGIAGISVNPQVRSSDIYWLIAICLLLFLFLIPARNSRLVRFEGAVLLGGYITYLLFLFL